MKSLKRFLTPDVATATILMLFSLWAWKHIETLPARAAIFPRLVVIMLLVLSLIYLVRELLRKTAGDPITFFLNRKRFALASILIVVYAVAFPQIGFFTSTFVFIGIFAYAFGIRSLFQIILGSGVFTVTCYVLFVVLLKRRLPDELLLSLLGLD